MRHNKTWVLEREEPLPTTDNAVPGSDSGNKSYILFKDPEDIKQFWKPDIFIDKAISIR